MDVDEARRNRQAARINLALPFAAHLAYRHNTVAFDGNVAVKRWVGGAIHEPPIADYEIEFRFRSPRAAEADQPGTHGQRHHPHTTSSRVHIKPWNGDWRQDNNVAFVHKKTHWCHPRLGRILGACCPN